MKFKKREANKNTHFGHNLHAEAEEDEKINIDCM